MSLEDILANQPRNGDDDPCDDFDLDLADADEYQRERRVAEAALKEQP